MKKYMKYSFLTFFLILAVLSFLIIRPFITALLTSIIVAYMAFPLYERINKRIKKDYISAATVMMIIVLIMGLIFGFLGLKIFKEVNMITQQNKFEGAFEKLSSRCHDDESMMCQSIDYITETIKTPETKKAVVSYLSRLSAWILTSIPSLFFEAFIFLFATFYLIKDSKTIIEYVGKIIPLKRSFKDSLKKQMNDLFYSTIYGSLIMAFIQGILGIAAFIIFDSTDSPFFWGIILAATALVPFIGTAIVWVPMSLFQITQGYLTESSPILWKGIGLFLFGALVISTIDNLLKPKIVGNRAGMHPMLILLGAFGGIAIMGIAGIFIGPLILAFFVSFLRVYHNEKSEIFEE